MTVFLFKVFFIMKFKLLSLFFIIQLFTGCQIPCEVYFRNFSGKTVRLEVKLADKTFFSRLPNKYSLYKLPKRDKQIYGDWVSNGFVTWTDTVSFYLDIPAQTILDIKDVSNGFGFGGSNPDIFLMLVADGKRDTIMNEYFPYVEAGFKLRRVFWRYDYYYDYK